MPEHSPISVGYTPATAEGSPAKVRLSGWTVVNTCMSFSWNEEMTEGQTLDLIRRLHDTLSQITGDKYAKHVSSVR